MFYKPFFVIVHAVKVLLKVIYCNTKWSSSVTKVGIVCTYQTCIQTPFSSFSTDKWGPIVATIKQEKNKILKFKKEVGITSKQVAS